MVAKMGEFKTISALPKTFEQIGLISTVTQKERYQMLYELFNELEEILKIAVQNEGKNGNIQFFYTLMTKRVGNTLQLAFVPRLAVKEKVGQKPITATYNRKGELVKVTE